MSEPATDPQVSLATYVDHTGVLTDADPFVVQCWAEAGALVGAYVGTATLPQAVLHRARLEVGSELFHRRQAPNGVAQFAALDGAPVRVARDPMVGAYPILNRYVIGGIG
ncbi:MAG: hypothetical protein HGA44_05575 [Cellulomonadaceae bacterium]|nr:hypothetical protein [Cellulomonadaceae bacterium]